MLVAFIGLATLLMAGFTALMQRDIKRILAYSTISQIGYMFLALGVGAWSAAIFHLMTHAFFKALLFLAAGTVILSLHHEHDIFRMGAMRRRLPVAFFSFLVGSAALTALPFTSGFYSKDEILLAALAQPQYGLWLWIGGVLGAFLTALYSFRLVFVVFFGSDNHQASSSHEGHETHSVVVENTSPVMFFPLLILGVLSLLGGLIHVPVESVFAQSAAHEEAHASQLIHTVMILIPVFGVMFSWFLYGSKSYGKAGQHARTRLLSSPLGGFLNRFWFSGWGMDGLYQFLFVRPFVALAQLNRIDVIDLLYSWVALATRVGNSAVVMTQTGNLRWYAISLVGGLVIVIGLGVWR